MTLEMFISLSSNVSLVVAAAYMIGRSRYLIKCINDPSRPGNWVPLIIIFTLLAIVGTYSGVYINGAYANTRIVGVLMGGLMGGPVVGTAVGMIGGFYRYMMGGFTAVTCASAAVIAGIVAGIVRNKVGLANLTWQKAALLAFAMEMVQKILVLLFAKPFEAAWALESVIAVPTTIVSVAGTIVFFLIVEDIKAAKDQHGATAAKVSLHIASRTQPHLRRGLTPQSAEKTVQIILEETQVDSVLICNCHSVLASAGKPFNEGHERDLNLLLDEVAAEKNLLVLKDMGGIENGVIAPLLVSGNVVGAVYLAREKKEAMTEVDIHIAEGLADLLAVQIQLADIDEQRKMREKAELKALQAQINPHFLFNTLSIIMSFCRTDPDMARKLLGHLATMMQRSFAQKNDWVTLGEEIDGVEAYLEIVKARFGPRLSVVIDIEEMCDEWEVPALSIQPLVENAVQHGLFPKLNACQLELVAKMEENGEKLIIAVRDNGVGIPSDKLESILDASSGGIGIKNIDRRLRSLYGETSGLEILSRPNRGTEVILRIPSTGKVSYSA